MEYTILYSDPVVGRSRTLLDVPADEFGNLIDPNTGQVIY